jgi:RNA binding exosome subunit
MKKIVIHKNIEDQYWYMLRQGLEMTIDERLALYFKLKKQAALLTNENPVPPKKKIKIRTATWM